ncbi:MAG: glycerophosphodiester phosphodiesterase, partial [Propionicimonas sp.]
VLVGSAVALLQPRLTSALQPAPSAVSSVPGPARTQTPPSATASPTPGPSTSGPASPTRGGPLAVMAHRGGQEVHQLETQQAMEAAARDGYSVETDVRYTADGVAVLVHDERATKGLDCGGQEIAVSKTSWKVLKTTCRSKPTAADPDSYPIPKYTDAMEAIAAASPDAWVFVEVKADQTRAQARDFVGVLTANGLRDRAVVTSTSRERLARIRAVEKDLPTMLFVAGEQVPSATLAGDGLWGVAVEQGVASESYLSELRAAGLKVVVWLLNDSRQWAEARRLKADVVMTDYPAKYSAWLASQPAR